MGYHAKGISMSKLWHTDEELFTLARQELFVAVVGDVMDKVGFLHQFLPPQIRPIDPDMVAIGRAMPVLEADCFEAISTGPDIQVMAQSFGLMLEALDNLKPHEIYVCTGASPRYALWGELMSTRAMKLGAVGVVADGYVRDTKGILDLGFPTFAYGSYAQDQGPRGKVIDYRVPIEIEDVRIKPGDIIFGDIDGVCVIPQEAEEEIFMGAIEKARGEKAVQKAIEDGMSTVEAFKTFGIM